MAISPTRATNKNAALALLLISLIVPCILKIQPCKAAPKTITVPDDYPTITAAIDTATEDATPSPSPPPSPSPTPTSTPIDMKPLPTALLAAVAILACVFGFGLIVNLLAGKKRKQ